MNPFKILRSVQEIPTLLRYSDISDNPDPMPQDQPSPSPPASPNKPNDSPNKPNDSEASGASIEILDEEPNFEVDKSLKYKSKELNLKSIKYDSKNLKYNLKKTKQ